MVLSVTLCLNALFPADNTWNQYPFLSEDAKLSLRQNCTCKRIPNSGEKSFAGAVRASPAHRLWTTEDAYAANQRDPLSISRMVLRFCKDDEEFTDPLLVITGPIATPFLGALLPTRKLLDLSGDDLLPLSAFLRPSCLSCR
jgi:hypothetical protein